MVLSDVRTKAESVFLAFLRIALGYTMVAHGWQKIIGKSPDAVFSFSNMHQNMIGFSTYLEGMGVPLPLLSAYLATAAEFLGGIGLIVGLFTPIAAFGVFFTMIVAIYTVHWDEGFISKKGGFEYPFMLMMTALYFMIRGAGCISLDALFCKNKCKENNPSPV